MAHQFDVDDMTCGHCIARVAQAIRAADPDANVVIDLPFRRVRIDGVAEREDYAAAIRAAGCIATDAS